jgi:hypothetical protein
LLATALDSNTDGEHAIDLDAVAEAVGKSDKPPFYYAEETQQNKFNCEACGTFNDILETFGYCSRCGTRNDLQQLKSKTIPRLRERINRDGPYETCAKEAVAAFDSFAGQYAKQLIRLVPMTQSRLNRLERMLFHNFETVATELKNVFDIDVLKGLDESDVKFATMMFHRRHVYEHRGGEADEKYIVDSGDTTVRLKQALRETQESAHRIASLVVKLATNLHVGFHEIIPPEDGAIAEFRRRSRLSAQR